MKHYIYELLMIDPRAKGAGEKLFTGYERTVERFGGIDLRDYNRNVVYMGILDADTDTEACEKLYVRFNGHIRPNGYHGRSMSVSDILRLRDDEDGTVRTYFCDSIGWRRIEEVPEGGETE